MEEVESTIENQTEEIENQTEEKIWVANCPICTSKLSFDAEDRSISCYTCRTFWRIKTECECLICRLGLRNGTYHIVFD